MQEEDDDSDNDSNKEDEEEDGKDDKDNKADKEDKHDEDDKEDKEDYVFLQKMLEMRKYTSLPNLVGQANGNKLVFSTSTTTTDEFKSG